MTLPHLNASVPSSVKAHESLLPHRVFQSNDVTMPTACKSEAPPWPDFQNYLDSIDKSLSAPELPVL